MAFAPNWKLTLFAGLFLPVLVALGSWQLDRATQKEELEAARDAADARPPELLDAGAIEQGHPEHLKRVRVEGRLDRERLVFLDNRTHEGRVGYELYVPLLGGDDVPAVLVGLGWMAAPALRSDLPDPVLPEGRLSLRGVLLREIPEAPVFGAVLEDASWPLRVQRLDMTRIAEAYGDGLYPWPVIVSAGEPAVQTHSFEAVRMRASTHRGYAAQWFGLAAVLAIGWLVASVRRTGARGDGT